MRMYFLLLFVIFYACTADKLISQTGIDEINFGGGGGFTGQVNNFKLKSDGDLFDKIKKIKEVSSKTTLEAFEKAQELKDYSFNSSDNVYSFIEIKSKGKINRIVWPLSSSDVDKKVIDLHNSLMLLTK
jgi:pyruvate/oxaloacetate carboxyltransferase